MLDCPKGAFMKSSPSSVALGELKRSELVDGEAMIFHTDDEYKESQLQVSEGIVSSVPSKEGFLLQRGRIGVDRGQQGPLNLHRPGFQDSSVSAGERGME